MQCKWTEDVILMSLGELEPGRADDVQGHMSTCTDCREAARAHLFLVHRERDFAVPELSESAWKRLDARLMDRIAQLSSRSWVERWDKWLSAFSGVLRPQFAMAALVLILFLPQMSEFPAPAQIPISAEQIESVINQLESLPVSATSSPLTVAENSAETLPGVSAEAIQDYLDQYAYIQPLTVWENNEGRENRHEK